MGRINNKTHDPAKCGYGELATNRLKRQHEKATLARKFQRCLKNRRFKCNLLECKQECEVKACLTLKE
jgi:hypothetical protein